MATAPRLRAATTPLIIQLTSMQHSTEGRVRTYPLIFPDERSLADGLSVAPQAWHRLLKMVAMARCEVRGAHTLRNRHPYYLTTFTPYQHSCSEFAEIKGTTARHDVMASGNTKKQKQQRGSNRLGQSRLRAWNGRKDEK